MLKPDFDWETHYENDRERIGDYFREACRLSEENDGKKWVSIQGYEPKDTPKSLYRLLFLLGPSHVDFSRMYKPLLFAFDSIDGKCAVGVCLYKYELALYFYVRPDIAKGREDSVQGGWADCDNGPYTQDADALKWFDMVRQCVEFEHDVYPGNNFKV
jgi:hypothetical protein